MRLDHVQLAAPPGAEARMRAFYGGVLGLPEAAKPVALAARGGVWFRGPGIEIHIGVEQAFRPARKAHPGIAVDGTGELEELAARLEEAGHRVRHDTALPGCRRFYVEDPVGNRLEFLARVS